MSCSVITVVIFIVVCSLIVNAQCYFVRICSRVIAMHVVGLSHLVTIAFLIIAVVLATVF